MNIVNNIWSGDEMRITVWLDDDEYLHTVEFIGDVKHEKISDNVIKIGDVLVHFNAMKIDEITVSEE